MRRYIESLDGIRGFGIFFVLCYHYLRLNDFNWTIIGFSWIWIQMFFVQSGFLITEILLASKHKPFGTYAGQFYWRRALRIFPVYFAYVLAFALIYIVVHKPDDFGERAPYLFTFTYNYTRLIPELDFNSVWFIHFWSLAVEEQFYLVWPVIVYFLDERKLRFLIVAVIIAIPVFRFWFTDYILANGFSAEMAGEITYGFTLSQFDAFMIGAAIPLFKLRQNIANPGKWVLIALAVVLAAGFLNYFILSSDGMDISWTSLGISVAMIENYQHVWSYSLINILFALVILYLIRESYTGIFNNRVLVSIGKIVYGMYIFHFALLFGFSRISAKIVGMLGIPASLQGVVITVMFVIAFVMTYGLAYVSYNYFEKRFLALKDYWPKQK
ncbi:MAG TPA: acyltransferase [Ohtaekwangia sp.]|nr:acyltransferase [Ohtaekwangia sp.]